MKQHLKNYLKLGILLFGMPLLLTNCEKDNLLLDSQAEVTTKSLYKVNTIKLSQIPNVRDFLIGKTNTNLFSRTTINGAIFDDDNILEVIDTLSNTNYTFRFTYPDTQLGEFYNLIVGKTPEGENITPYVLKYVCDNEYLDMFVENNFDFHFFNGTVSLYKYTDFFEQGGIFSKTTSIYNTDTDTNCPPEYNENGDPIPCQTAGVVDGGSGGGSGDGGDPSGGDNGSGISGGNSGGSGSGSCTWEWVYTCWCEGELVGVHDHTPVVLALNCPSSLRNSIITNNNDCPDCPTGTDGGVGVLTNPSTTPCPGDPVTNPEIAPQYGSSGTKGALYGCTRYGNDGCQGEDNRDEKHNGIDIKNEYGSPIYAMFDGEVLVNYHQKSKAGYVTRIRSELPNGEIIIYQYFHMQDIGRLSSGTTMRAGDVVGYQGDSGNLKLAIKEEKVDSHVHIKMNLYDGTGDTYDYANNFKNNPVNPADYMHTQIDEQGNSNTLDCN